MPLDATGCEREEPLPLPANGGTQSGSSGAPDLKEKRGLFGRSFHFGRPCTILLYWFLVRSDEWNLSRENSLSDFCYFHTGFTEIWRMCQVLLGLFRSTSSSQGGSAVKERPQPLETNQESPKIDWMNAVIVHGTVPDSRFKFYHVCHVPSVVHQFLGWIAMTTCWVDFLWTPLQLVELSTPKMALDVETVH